MAGFQVVENEAPPQAPPQNNAVAMQMLTIALKALSDRALTGISAAFSLLGLASVWALWWHILATPSAYQLTGLGMYSIFLLALEIIRRRK
jgi:hypothetical protein